MSARLDEAVNMAAALCRHFEGFSSKPYICPAGYPTIGYGTVYKPDGTKVTMQDLPISKETAESWLLHELRNNYMVGVLRASPGLIGEPKILAAITDFAYNLGVGRYRGSTLRRKINAKDWDGAAEQLMRWVNGTVQGVFRPLPGLVRRRKAEVALLKGV
jgi:lysozyme